MYRKHTFKAEQPANPNHATITIAFFSGAKAVEILFAGAEVPALKKMTNIKAGLAYSPKKENALTAFGIIEEVFLDLEIANKVLKIEYAGENKTKEHYTVTVELNPKLL